jgi:hypothetical protein
MRNGFISCITVINLFLVCCVQVQAQPIRLAAQDGENTMQEQPRGALQGLLLNIKANKSEYLSTDAIILTMTLKNAGKSDVLVGFSNPINFFKFHVTLSTSEEAPRTLRGARIWESRLHIYSMFSDALAPGQELSVTLPISALYDMTLTGKYQISASVATSGVQGAKVPLTVDSNIVSINMNGEDAFSPFYKPVIRPDIPGKHNPFLVPNDKKTMLPVK